MNKSNKISISPPQELQFDCASLNDKDIKCSQAFPDLTSFDGNIYLAFRTAPSHFPSSKASIQIFSSGDGREWHLEHSLDHTQDLRDPHFLQFKGSLYLFFMSLSRKLFTHEPEYIYFIKKTTDGWSARTVISTTKSGFWNIKVFKEKVYMSIYTNNGLDNKRTKSHFNFIASHDLVHWDVVFDSPISREKLGRYQTSEASFDFDDHGNIFGTIRSIIYPNLNFMIPRTDPHNWKLTVDKFKCDGPNLFSHNGQYFLIARRSLFHRLSSEPFRLFHYIRKTINILRYSLSKKRTALYHFDPQSLKLKHIRDLPSHGDTGYSAVTPITPNQYLLVYYSSDINSQKDLNWLSGQLGRTKLYSAIITLE